MNSKLFEFLNFMESNPKYYPYVRSIRSLYPNCDAPNLHYAEKFLKIAERTLGKGTNKTLADGYVAFAMDVSRSQLKYELQGHYANQSYEQVFEATYNNEDFMNLYHWGVFASTFLWHHHLEIVQLFNDKFLPLVNEGGALRCFDLGAGSGIWSWQLLKKHRDAFVDAVDISNTSATKLKELMHKDNLGSKVNVHVSDATNWFPKEGPSIFDCGISCFLLEHLEKPELLVNNVSKLLKPRHYAFITAALTAAEVDHIYEFKRESEILLMMERAGLRVVDMKSLGPSNYPQENKFLPRSIAMIVSKNEGELW